MRDLPKRNLTCPCGAYIRGDDEDDLVQKAMQHLRDEHPELADEYGRDEILFIAY
ncbi:MAG: hypothetical protein JWR63_290 [Conexibacter sp.]|nr:hypothetical protein [Conexibacter sp.]